MMLLPRASDAVHKAWLYRLLTGIADDSFLVAALRFKGGTCAAMQGFVDRFSVDLDFDLIESEKKTEVCVHLEKIFGKLGLAVKDKSAKVPQYFLKYPNKGEERNTIELDVVFPPPKSNEYEAVRFEEIDRIIYCQTLETMFANKLVAVLDRYQRHGSIAARDLFDIHTFLLAGRSYRREVIEERTGKSAEEYIADLKVFIEKCVTQTHIDQDLNTLLSADRFKKVRGVIKREVLMFL